MHPERLELLVQIATWYYEEDLSQEDIAGRVGLSRPMVSRLLQKARDHGLSEIRVLPPQEGRHTGATFLPDPPSFTSFDAP